MFELAQTYEDGLWEQHKSISSIIKSSSFTKKIFMLGTLWY